MQNVKTQFSALVGWQRGKMWNLQHIPTKNRTAHTFKLPEVTVFWSKGDQVIPSSWGHTKNSYLNLTICKYKYMQFQINMQTLKKPQTSQKSTASYNAVVLLLTSKTSHVRRKVPTWAQIMLKQKISHFFCWICSWSLILPQGRVRKLLARPGSCWGLRAPHGNNSSTSSELTSTIWDHVYSLHWNTIPYLCSEYRLRSFR